MSAGRRELAESGIGGIRQAAGAGPLRRRLAVLPGRFPSGEKDIRGIFVVDYARSVQDAYDVDVFVTTRNPTTSDPAAEVAGVRIRRGSVLPPGLVARSLPDPVFDLLWCRKTLNLLREAGPHVVHSHRVLPDALVAGFYGRRHGAAVVVTVHTGPFSKLLRTPLTRYLTRRALERDADLVLAVSRHQADRILAAGIRPKRLEVTHNPVDTELFRPNPGRRERRFIFAGRLEPYKGALRVVLAFQRIHRNLPGWTATVVGEGSEEGEIRSLLEADSELRGKVELPGVLPKPVLAALIGSSGVFVFPSEHETFGLVVAEAMAAGLPVVVTDRTAPREYVDKRSGLLVPPDDVEALAQGMDSVARGLDCYDREAIRSRIVERFSLPVFGARLRRLYEEVV